MPPYVTVAGEGAAAARAHGGAVGVAGAMRTSPPAVVKLPGLYNMRAQQCARRQEGGGVEGRLDGGHDNVRKEVGMLAVHARG